MGILLLETVKSLFYMWIIVCCLVVTIGIVGLIKLWRDISAAAYEEEWEKQVVYLRRASWWLILIK